MMDLIRISTTDPVWMTWVLVFMRFVAAMIVIWWITSMVRTNQGTPVWYNRAVLWPWSLTGWMLAVAILLVSGIIRVLIVGHIRAQTDIGIAFRAIEIAVAVNFAAWSVITYWRWRHPESTIIQEGVFGTLAQALPIIVSDHKGTIQFTTAEFDALVGTVPGALVGKQLEVIMPKRYHSGHAHGMQRYIETREPHIMGTVVSIDMLRQSGVEIPVHLALNTTEVEGNPWFVASIWPRQIIEPEVLKPKYEDVNIRQDHREVEQNVHEVYLDKRAESLDRRGIGQDQRQVIADERQVIADERQATADDRDTTADDRDTTADARDVTACARDVTADDRDAAEARSHERDKE